jgi:hypothetical protein
MAVPLAIPRLLTAVFATENREQRSQSHQT